MRSMTLAIVNVLPEPVTPSRVCVAKPSSRPSQSPAIILAPNKTLAAQLYAEMREFFPENAVEYFGSYYDYYQPEAYVPAWTPTSRKILRSTRT